MEVGVEVEVDRETETEVDREVVVEVGSEMGGVAMVTLMFLSPLAQLLMMESDCWKRVPPMPRTSAIS